MEWCCTRCGHRQSDEKACERCGAESVHDLRSRATRELLADAASRHREAKENLAKKLAAGAGVTLCFVLIPVGVGLIGGLVAGIAAGAALWQGLERALYTPKFPFLADLPPADRP